MVINTKKQIKNVSARSYLIKDRDAFLADLVSYAKTFYPDQINDFINHGGLVLGICNGFQVLVRTGLLPFGAMEKMQVTLTDNDSGK